MAQLKDTVISGNLRVTDKVLAGGVKTNTVEAPTESGGSTYGAGTNGQVLKTNGTNVFWGNEDVAGVKVGSDTFTPTDGIVDIGSVLRSASDIYEGVEEDTPAEVMTLTSEHAGNPLALEIELKAIQLNTSVNLIPDGTDTDNGYVSGNYLTNANVVTVDANWYISEYFEVTAGDYYTLKCTDASTNAPAVCFYDTNKTFISGVNVAKTTKYITVPTGAVYARCSQCTEIGKFMQFEKGYGSTEIMPYCTKGPIYGHKYCKINATTKNLYVKDTITKDRALMPDGTVGYVAAYNSQLAYTDCIPVDEGSYTLHGTLTTAAAGGFNTRILGYDANKNFVSVLGTDAEAASSTTFSLTITVPSGIKYVRISGLFQISNDTQFEAGSTATTYAPGNNSVNIPLYEDIYGGKLTIYPDYSGKLYTDKGMVDLGTLTWEYDSTNNRFKSEFIDYMKVGPVRTMSGLCMYYNVIDDARDISEVGDMSIYYGGDYESVVKVYIHDSRTTDPAEFKKLVSRQKFVYELQNPTEKRIPADQLKTVLGETNIYSDCGRILYAAFSEQEQSNTDLSVVTLAEKAMWNSKSGNFFYVEGDDTNKTAGTWTGTCSGIKEYYNGLTIIFVPKVAGASTTNLNINGLGNIVCYLTDQGAVAKLTTHYPVGTPIPFTYYNGKFIHADYSRANDNTTNIVNLYHNGGNYVADSAVYRYQLLFQIDENTLTPLNNNSNSTGTAKTMLVNRSFDPFGRIYYYSSTTAVAENGGIGGTVLFYSVLFDARYTFNCAKTLTSHKPLYLKVIPQDDGSVKLSGATCWTNALPSTNDGYWYILIGRTYSTYQVSLYPFHPVFRHNGTKIVQVHEGDFIGVRSLPAVSSSDNGKFLMVVDGAWTAVEMSSAEGVSF